MDADLLATILIARSASLNGRTATVDEVAELQRTTGPLPSWLARAYREAPLIGACMALPNPDPEFESFGEVLRWLSPAEILDELSLYEDPGAFRTAGLFPVGLAFSTKPDGTSLQNADLNCVRGHDPDPPLINVSHETGPDAECGDLVVLERLSEWFRSAPIVSPPVWRLL